MRGHRASHASVLSRLVLPRGLRELTVCIIPLPHHEGWSREIVRARKGESDTKAYLLRTIENTSWNICTNL